MGQFVVDTAVKDGRIELDKLPFREKMKVKVVVIPKIELKKMSFSKLVGQKVNVDGSIADLVSAERDER